MLLNTFPKIKNEHKNSLSGITKESFLGKSFLNNDNNSLFIKSNNNFHSHIKIHSVKKDNGFLLEILFHGLNYSAKRTKLARAKYHLDVHKAEVFICDEKPNNIFKSRIYKRRLLFFSYDQHLIHRIERVIKEIKSPNIYTGKGLFSREDLYTLKEGKKRK